MVRVCGDLEALREISGSISFSPLVFPFPEPVPHFVCHSKGSLHFWGVDSGHEIGGRIGSDVDYIFRSFPARGATQKTASDIADRVGAGTMLFSPLTWAVRLENSTLV